jgi:hypothetical protein
MIVVLARESAMRRQTTPRKLAVRLARKIFIVRKASAAPAPMLERRYRKREMRHFAPFSRRFR